MKHTFAAHAFRAHAFRPGALAGGEVIPPEPPPSDGTVIIRVDQEPDPPLEAADYVFGGVMPRYSAVCGQMPRMDRPGPYHLVWFPRTQRASIPRVEAQSAPGITRTRESSQAIQRPDSGSQGPLPRPASDGDPVARPASSPSTPLKRLP